jgi:hypothetical protein
MESVESEIEQRMELTLNEAYRARGPQARR